MTSDEKIPVWPENNMERSANWLLGYGEGRGYNTAARERDPIIRGLLSAMRTAGRLDLNPDLLVMIEQWEAERQ